MIMISMHVDSPFEPLVDWRRLSTKAQATLRHQGLAVTDAPDAPPLCTIVFTDDERVRELNRSFRSIDAPTDVLSFPNQNFTGCASPLSPSKSETDQSAVTLILPEEFTKDTAAYLGDIIIAVPYTQRQALAEHRTLDSELDLLVVHGMLHLLGYDHDTAEDEARMWAIQDEILNG